ncbi:hypothetical protein KP79_PYT12679 [Mizuhopecten yessoensis]|uniref:Uncharacterized protein n=1 Tax=Mizuhopecten yessoensis TaxID=6573 RepID=A0A210PLE9_MIZYE|nr:hypothetical protein KP79_PYT12679 [Mizuhopecten yessoensis]
MEDQDLKGLQSLVCHKQQKTYTRMVSQEFSCAESHTPVQGGRRRRRSKKSSTSVGAETVEDTSGASSSDQVFVDPLAHVLGDEQYESEESEYFSAEEEHDECFLDETFSTNSSNDSVEGDQSNEHSKAPSKKQKKKRKELAKLNGPLFPFGNADFIDIDFPDLREEISLTASRSVFTEVPSLVELCILASRKVPRDSVTYTIPGGIKQIVKLSNNRLGLQKIQLSWLLKLLPFVEQCDTIKLKKNDDQNKIPFVYRNIWCSDMYSHVILIDQLHDSYDITSATCYLPHTFIWSLQNYYETKHQTNTLQLSVLANTIDLMLPPTIPHKSVNRKRRSSSQSEEDMMSADTDRMLLRVKSELEKKFPLTIKRFYPHVLPYVFWARGLLPKAARLFSDLAANEVKYRKKARYLYEVGRMYSHFDEAETAIAFYKGAEDAVLSKPKNRNEKRSLDVEQQTRALCADACDQGPMTWQKAQQAGSLWATAVQPPDAGRLSYPLPGMFAADSLLCFHAGIGRDDVKSWLSSCVERLEKISQCCPEVYFYLSQIYAWAGLAKDSATAYRTFLLKGWKDDSLFAPGQQNANATRPERQPWKVLLQMVQSPTTSGTPKPLSVLWRTRLGPPRLYDVKASKRSWEADIKSVDVNLSLSREGKITGDLQIVLPPIRGVQLDPHTGMLCFPYLPGETVPWKSFYEFNMDNSPANGPTLMPTPVELYCDHRGNKVHLLRSSAMVVTSPSELDSNLLFWTGADGRRSKINLCKKVKDSVHERVEKDIYSRYISDEEKYERCKKLLEKCYKSNKLMKPNDMDRYITRVIQSERRKTDKVNLRYLPDSFVCSVKTPARFSSTLVIPMSYPDGQIPTHMCLMFVDCSSMETFSEPRICHRNHQRFFSEDLSWNDENHVPRTLILPHADLAPVSISANEVIYYDKFAEEYEIVHLDEVDLECGLPQVYRNQVYYVNKDSRLTTHLNGFGTIVDHFPFVDKMVVCRNVTIMTTTETLIFADSISFLPLEVLISDQITPSIQNGVDCKDRVKYLKVIGEKEILKDSGIKCNQVAIALDTHLVVVEIPLCQEPEFIEMILCVELPGHAKDICFLSPLAGVLVSVTQHVTLNNFPRETLYQFDYHGRLRGLLPGLGEGPRSFLPLMLPVSTEGAESDKKAWHIYMRDGHDGILCICLD